MSLAKQLEFFFDAQARPADTAAPVAPPLRESSVKTPLIPTVCPPSLPAGARWREVQTASQAIGFVLQRSRRKSIGLVINDDGLQITAPNWVTLRQVDATVVEKAKWILQKLDLRQARQQQLAMAHTHWQEGGDIPYLGKRIILALGQATHQSLFKGDALSPGNGDVLYLALPGSADHNRVRDSAHSWLQQQAKSWFGQRLQHFAQANGLQVSRWRLSSAATRWGSCSSDGNIMLNWRLIHFDYDIIDYVIVHELAHLREMNHSKNFWREVGRILPGFEQARNTLRQHDPASLPLI